MDAFRSSDYSEHRCPPPAPAPRMAWRSKDGRAWRVGGNAEIAWIQENTECGLAITSAIPPLFEAYATLELPRSDGQKAAPSLQDRERHDAGILAVLSAHAMSEPWWLGFLDTGAADVVFDDVATVNLYADWRCVLIEAGSEQAAGWRRDEQRWRSALPDSDVSGRSLVARLDPLGRRLDLHRRVARARGCLPRPSRAATAGSRG